MLFEAEANPSAMNLGRLGGRVRATALAEKSSKEIASGAVNPHGYRSRQKSGQPK
jgi:hypothetical protein